ncbi:choline transporter-like protein 2 isoform X2 [Ptychodera flava]|uniref:choline transporter-like protein 2 isoform X2 n=1 Tax=Ptychodera flava TaxID=63121 RepID=UPI00396A9884
MVGKKRPPKDGAVEETDFSAPAVPKDENESGKSKYGEPLRYDPSFHGPIANRGCTDIICCILFLLFISGMFVIGYFGWSRGDPNKLIYPTDSRGRICGYDDGLENKTNLFFFDLLACADTTTLLELACPTPQVCVNSCPPNTWIGYYEQKDLLVELGKVIASFDPSSWEDLFNIAESTQKADRMTAADRVGEVFWSKFICDYGIDPKDEFVVNGHTPFALFEMEMCASYYVTSKDLFQRCVPSYLVDAIGSLDDALTDLDNRTLIDPRTGQNITGSDIGLAETALAAVINAQQLASRVLQDFQKAWHLILGALVLSSILSFLWILVMRWVAGVMVWFGILAMFALLVFGQYYCYSMYIDLKNVPGSDASFTFTLNLKSYLELRDTWLAFGIIQSVITLIMLLILIFLCKRIRIAIELIKEGSRAVSSMMFTLLWPIIPYLMQIVIIVLWAFIAVYLATSGQATYMVANVPTNYEDGNLVNGSSCQPEIFNSMNTSAICVFVEYGGDPNLFRMQIYALFGLFWMMCFVVALGQIVLAGAFASYYWAFHKPKDIPSFPVTMSLGRALRYHLGSLAFGSLIIAIVKIIRVLLEYMEKKLKGAENRVARFILRCLKCCFWCLEKCLKFINKNAYIMIAVYGKSFCPSAKKAFFLLMRNIVRVVVLDKMTDFLLFIGKFCIILGVGVGSFYFFSGRVDWFNDLMVLPSLNYYWIPIILIIVGTYFIASCFFSVYNMAVDTLFLCFLEDLERHDGSAEKPYYMNKGLMKILGKKNKKPEAE